MLRWFRWDRMIDGIVDRKRRGPFLREEVWDLAVRDLGRDVRYTDAFALQEQLVERRVADEIPDTLLLLEHHPVFSLGRNADIENVLVAPDALREAGFDVEATTRGGDVTYHGPGQLVGYPILKLSQGARSVLKYVTWLEQVLIDLLADYGIDATRDNRNRGVWVGDAKIAALGIRVTRGVSMHGLALNVAPDLSHYGFIVPCGIAGADVTSMADRLETPPEMADVKQRLVTHLRARPRPE